VPPLPGQEFTYTSRRALAGATVAGTAVTAADVAEATSDDDQPKEGDDA
jgi:hypothetical protein